LFNSKYVVVVSIALILLAGGCSSNNKVGQKETKASTKKQTLLRDFKIKTPLFASNSPWNQKASDVAVLPNSNEQIVLLFRVLLGDKSTLEPRDDASGMNEPFPVMHINYDEYTMPIFKTGQGTQKISMVDYEGNESWSNEKIKTDSAEKAIVPNASGPIRAANPKGIDSDGHLVLYSPDTRIEYDFWQAEVVKGKGSGNVGQQIIDAGAIDFFDTTKMGVNPNGYYSARTVGTPLLAGLLLPEDIENGAIKHAMSVAIPGLKVTNTDDTSDPSPSDYFYPASATEDEYLNTDSDSLAAGQRLRLKNQLVYEDGESIDEEELAPVTKVFLDAMREYGAYIVDNAGGLIFYSEDISTANIDLADEKIMELADLPGKTLPEDKTKWQILMEALNKDINEIPLAAGSWEQDPEDAKMGTTNFEVIENAKR